MKVVQILDTYPLFYQPYLEPVIDGLSIDNSVDLDLKIFQKNSKTPANVEILKDRITKRIYRWIYSLTGRKNSLTNSEKKFLAYDIVHLQHSYLFPKIVNLLKLPRQDRPKVIITLRGGDTYVKPWMFKKWTTFYTNEGKWVDAYITMSNNQKEYLQKWGIEATKIHVVPISFGNKFIIDAKEPNKDVLKIVSVFRMCWEKNIDGNLQVIKWIKEAGINVQYDIYGGGGGRGALHYLIDKYNLQESVNDKGEVANDELKKMLPSYDFILQMSLSEAFPTSVLEAQAFGLPAVVSDSGGLPEAVKNGVTGVVVPSYETREAAQKTIALWKEPEVYKRYSAAAIHSVQNNFNTEREVNQLIALYTSLFN